MIHSLLARAARVALKTRKIAVETRPNGAVRITHESRTVEVEGRSVGNKFTDLQDLASRIGDAARKGEAAKNVFETKVIIYLLWQKKK